jgi:MFS family permease
VPGTLAGVSIASARRDAIVLLVVLGAGVFLAGLELMITAVALPSILRDLADITQLRHASWIVNGYLLVYVVSMPLSGRLADLWGVRRLFLAGLTAFTLGSALAGAAPTLDLLIAARLVQGLGGGILVPVGTAAASHLFDGHARARALGVIGALTFLGMAAGPFAGAAILSSLHPGSALAGLGLAGGPLAATLATALAPAWRWVFYLNVPIGLAAIALAWAASAGWDTPHRAGSVDLPGAILFSTALVAGLGALTLLGSPSDAPGPDPLLLALALAAASILAAAVFIRWALRRPDPFLDPRLFRDTSFASASVVSLLTGYAFATAIVGGALFVDRVLYGGPDDQRLALGALAGATALGALLSGFAIRVVSLRLVSLVGLAASVLALGLMSRWDATVPIAAVAGLAALFGLGFGLTVTPRSTAAVEAAGRRAFGIASATVTVARMTGMAVGLAILAAYGSTVIAGLYDRVIKTPDGYKSVIPVELRDRPRNDGLVVQALESWAAGQAAAVMVGLFVVAAGVTAAAAPAAFALGSRPRMLSAAAPQRGTGLSHSNATNATDTTPAIGSAAVGPQHSQTEDDGGTDEEPATIAL